MNSYEILFQAYAEEAREERYTVTADAVHFQLEHGDEWPFDNGRPNYEYDRIELSIKPHPDPRDWLLGKNTFSYKVAAPWQIAAQQCGDGHVILGQIHAGAPFFSLRWAPLAKSGQKRLWADFMTHSKDHSYGSMFLNELLATLEDDQPVAVELKTDGDGTTLSVDISISAVSVPESFRCAYWCYPARIDPKQASAIRFKIGAYRTRKDFNRWDTLNVTYTDILINSNPIDPDQLKNANYDDGFDKKS